MPFTKINTKEEIEKRKNSDPEFKKAFEEVELKYESEDVKDSRADKCKKCQLSGNCLCKY